MAEGVAGRGLDGEAVGSPFESLVVFQDPGRAHALRQSEEGLAHVVDVVDLTRSPEYLDLFEVGEFVGGHGEGDIALVRQGIALALVAVVVSMENPVDLTDADIAEVIKYATAAKVYEQSPAAVRDHIDIAGVAEEVEMVGYFL